MDTPLDAFFTLATGSEPAISWVGVGLCLGSIILMPLLGRAKRRLGEQLDSAATSGEGTQNMLCAYLATATLVGLLANALLGAWWLDSVAALSSPSSPFGKVVRRGAETPAASTVERRRPSYEGFRTLDTMIVVP